MTPDLLCSRSSVGLGEETATRAEVEWTGTGAAPPPTHHSPNQTVCRARFGSNSGISRRLGVGDEGPESSVGGRNVTEGGGVLRRRHLTENALATLEVQTNQDASLFRH